jgi:predicted TIM-barrel fold metal-dependent hydrolase
MNKFSGRRRLPKTCLELRIVLTVDSHAHVDEVPALGWMDPASALIALMDDAQIDRAIVMTYTELPAVNPNALEYLAGQIALYPNRLIGYVRVHPWYAEVLDLIDRAFGEFNMKGVKLHPVGNLAHPASEASLRVIRRAAAHRAPVLFHCGDEALTTPLQIALAAEAVPEATIIPGSHGRLFSCRRSDRRGDALAEPVPGDVGNALSRPDPSGDRRARAGAGAVRLRWTGLLAEAGGPQSAPGGLELK